MSTLPGMCLSACFTGSVCIAQPSSQVMAREIFNPNFSLFVPVPMGGSTFQPNPNSVVQNDEARGTNHLDFFKFVGRCVGKALHDGHLIDAYFTRSFYKHMLAQPLTYQVRACLQAREYLMRLAIAHDASAHEASLSGNFPRPALLSSYLQSSACTRNPLLCRAHALISN